MSFTDEDLKELKELCDFRGWHEEFTAEKVKGLIARLEAAEKCAEQLYWHNEKLGCVSDGSSLERYNKRANEALDEWRKAAGKEGGSI